MDCKQNKNYSSKSKENVESLDDLINRLIDSVEKIEQKIDRNYQLGLGLVRSKISKKSSDPLKNGEI